MLRRAPARTAADQPVGSVPRVQGTRDRRAPPRIGRAAPPGRTARAPAGGSSLLGGREPIAAARQVVVIPGHADDAAGLAPSFGREAVDVRATPGRPPIGRDGSRADCSVGPREPALGLSADRGRAEGPGIVVSATTVRKMLREEQRGPANKRTGPTWREFFARKRRA